MSDAQVDTIKQLELLFRQPDAVMEPGIFDKIKTYVAAGGNAPNAVQDLSDGYQGYGPMSSLVVQWTRQLAGRAPPAISSEPVRDEVFFLSELTKQHFAPDKVSGFFNLPAKKRSWANALIKSREGRQLIYDLSRQHQTPVLDFFIQRIMAAGHHSEISGIGVPLAGYFSVFHALLVSKIKEVPYASAVRLRQIARELQESSCKTQHAYAYAQMLLSDLAHRPRGSRYRRLSQELAGCVAEAHGAAPWHMASLFAPVQLSIADQEAMTACTAYLTSADVSIAAAAASTLHQLYSAFDPPAISVLHHPYLLRRLSDDLFEGGLDPKHTEDLVAVLVLACSAVDDRTSGGDLDKQDSEPAAAALCTAVQLGLLVATGQRLSQSHLAEAGEVAQVAVAACGLLRVLLRQAAQASYWRDPAHAITCLALLVPIAQHQPCLHSQVLEFVLAALAALGSVRADIVKAYLQVAVMLLQGPEAMGVLQAIEDWAQTSPDPSLVRSFVWQTLALAAPPYASDFAASLVRLMVRSNVRRARGVGRNDELIRLLDEFVKATVTAEFDPPLTADETTYLEDLRAHV